MAVRSRSIGDPLVIEASEWNDIKDVTNAAIEGRSVGARRTIRRNRITLNALNNRSTKLSRFHIGTIEGVKWDPTNNMQRLAFNRADSIELGDVVAGDDRIAIVTGVIEPNRWGRAVVFGTVPCQVDVQDTNHQRATPIDNDSEKLQSGDSGPVWILSELTTTGVQWVNVLLDRGGAGARAYPAYTKSVISAATGDPGSRSVGSGTIDVWDTNVSVAIGAPCRSYWSVDIPVDRWIWVEPGSGNEWWIVSEDCSGVASPAQTIPTIT